MPRSLPFCAWRYNTTKVNIEDVIAPQYDVVSQEEVNHFKNKSPYNIFHLELPESYQRAKELLNSWIKEQILIKNQTPGIYLYELEFTYHGKKFNRKGFINLIELSPFEEGKILPHEKVYNKVTDERLELFKNTGFQFSQVFGLYEDPELFTLKNLKNKKKLIYSINYKGEKHKLYKITDKEFVKNLIKFLEDKRIYIADGHHRYTTALRYKEYMENLYGKKNYKDYNYIAMYICPLEDKNLLMLPTHRTYFLEDPEGFLKKLKNFAEVFKEINFKPENFDNYFNKKAQEWLIFLNNKAYFFCIKKEFLEKIKTEDPILSEVTLYNFLKILELSTGLKEEQLKEKGRAKFVCDINEVIKEVQRGAIGIIFPIISPLVLKKVAQAKKRMPHKCTYFYPKILTGILLNEISGKDLKIEL